MNDATQPTLEQDLNTIVSQLPRPIRTFLASDKIDDIAKQISDTYRLRIDQGTIVKREILLLVLGLKNPTEFTKTLADEAALDGSVIDGIAKIVNDRIFMPLQQESYRSSNPSAPQKTPSIQPPQPPFATSPTPYASRPIQSTTPRMMPPQPPANLPGMMPNFARRLENREEPHIEVGDRRQATEDRQVPYKPTMPQMPTQPPTWQTAPTPQPLKPFMSQPMSPPPRPFASQPAPRPPIPQPPRSFTNPPPPPMRPKPPATYSADPYREPFDEK